MVINAEALKWKRILVSGDVHYNVSLLCLKA